MHRTIIPLLSIYNHFHLLKGFVSRDIKGRFAASFGGLIWTILSPLATIIAYFFIFSIILRISITPEETGTGRFSIFFLCGFFPWNLLADSLSKAVGVLVAEASIITKVVFPVELLPVSIVISTLVVNSIGFFIFLVYLSFAGYMHLYWLLIPVALMLEAFFIMGIAFFVSALCVFFRDIGELLGIIILLWFFGTPVIYPSSMAPSRLEWFYDLNPMVAYVGFIRKVILQHTFDHQSFLIMCICAMISYMLGTWFFMRSKGAFGDVL